MNKRKESKKTAVFELEPDGFSIHTFELSKQMTRYEFHQMKDVLYCGNKSGEEAVIYQKWKGCHYYKKYEKHGMRIYLEHNQNESGFDTYFVRMIVNPRMLIEPGCSYLGILPPEESSIKKLQRAFKKRFEDTVFDSNINQYYLSRLDLCTNIRCDNKSLFRELVRVLRKLPTPPKYERKFFAYSKKKSRKEVNKDNKHYLRFCCGTHELVVYDKTYQIREGGLIVDHENLPNGVLRFEVHCERAYIQRIEKKSGAEDVLDVLWLLIDESEDRMIDHFSRCFLDTEFMWMEGLKQRIKESGFKKENKEAMLDLAKRLQRIQSVDKALEKMQRSGFNTSKLLDRFEKLGVSPIPLRKNFCAEKLPGPVELLKHISDGEIPVDYVKVKYK